jgi:hypothetical protein
MKAKSEFKKFKGILCVLLVIVMALGAIPYCGGFTAEAKTSSSAAAENVFFYVTNSDGEDVLLKVMPLDELIGLSHGQLSGVATGSDTGENYYFSATDNLPAAIYAEGRGFTLPELVGYVKDHCNAFSSPDITFTGNDRIYLMATDSYGTYNRNWTYSQLYGVSRYYFPGLFDTTDGWNSGWEISGGGYGPTSSDPMPLSVYNSQYAADDEFHSDKLDVFNSGIPTAAILAPISASGRIASEIASEVAAHGGAVTGCLEDSLTTETALTLYLPQSEDVLMTGNRTAYHNFKWIYNMKLEMASKPDIQPLGTVAAPSAEVSMSPDGYTMNVAMDCATEGADIYYSFEVNAPQILCTGSSVSYDTRKPDPVTGVLQERDLAADPVVLYMRAAREGYKDAGIVRVQYPPAAPLFETLYSGMVGSDLVFAAAGSVAGSEWNNWSTSISAISVKSPSASAYQPLAGGVYTVSNDTKTVTFNRSLFTTGGVYNFMISADGYANRTLSVTMMKTAPALVTASKYYIGSDIVVQFDDTAYQAGMAVRVALKGSSLSPDTISSSYLDRSIPGRLTIRSSYFSYNNCTIKNPGVYTLTLTNNNYTPASRTVDITVAPASEKPAGDTFTYVLSPGASGGTVGDTVTVNVSLISSQSNYLLYGGGYRLALDNSYLELTGVNPSGIWSGGTKVMNDGTTALTFGTLDRTGDGITAGSLMNVGSFTVKLLKAGSPSNMIQSADAMLTDGTGAARENVSGSNLSFIISGPVTPNGPDVPAGGVMGGGGGGETKTEIVKDAGGAQRAVAVARVAAETNAAGKATASVDKGTLNDALAQALKTAADADAEAGNKAGTTGVEVKLRVSADANATAVETSLPADVLKAMSQQTNTRLTVSSPVAEITLDQKALAAIAGNGSGNVTISAEKLDASALPEEARQKVGDAQVYDLKVLGENGAVTSFNGGTATVSVPYELKPGESAEQVTIYYIDSAGNLVKMNCVYDAETKTARFTTDHFSYYAVVIEKGLSAFTDIKRTDWYYDAVSFAVGKGLFNGTSETAFSPNAGMTRAMFVTVLGRAGGVKAEDYTASGFSDVAAGSWYGGYVQWAYENKIISGVGGGVFAPDQLITRAQMASILTNYSKWKGAAPESAVQPTYTDLANVPDWAAKGVSFCTAKGWLTGYPDGSFQPQKTATRAEAATMLYKGSGSGLL